MGVGRGVGGENRVMFLLPISEKSDPSDHM